MAREKDIFLVAKYLTTPRNHRKTFVKGYMKDDNNISLNEQVTVTRGLKDRDLTAAIILNITKQTVIKCRFNLGEVNDWETLANYYSKGYPQYLTLLKPVTETKDDDAKPDIIDGKTDAKDADADVTIDEGDEDGPGCEDGPEFDGYEERVAITASDYDINMDKERIKDQDTLQDEITEQG